APPPPRAPEASDRPVPRPGAAYASNGMRLREPDPDCDGARIVCIRLAQRLEDTCGAIETLALAHDLPPGFFARLIWRESLFDPYAVSPAGALGIAQFMPGTARLRGLDDPFNPAAALAASAAYLADLRDTFGNLGLAAAAYNGGEDRAARFVAGSGGLPGETRAYVAGITGYSALDWRDRPPASLDLALDAERPFSTACIALASARQFPQYRSAPDLAPWAVIVAAHRSHDLAAARYRMAAARNPVLQDNDPVIARMHLRSMRAPQFVAQIGAQSRTEAVRLCNRIRQYGTVCTVLHN
ncbi:lytic transglycosylase domain-containing protein, partial [Mangrovicoccus algicola]